MRKRYSAIILRTLFPCPTMKQRTADQQTLEDQYCALVLEHNGMPEGTERDALFANIGQIGVILRLQYECVIMYPTVSTADREGPTSLEDRAAPVFQAGASEDDFEEDEDELDEYRARQTDFGIKK